MHGYNHDNHEDVKQIFYKTRTMKFRQTLDWKTLFPVLRQIGKRPEMAKRHEL